MSEARNLDPTILREYDTRPRYQSFLSVAYGVMLGLDTQTPEP